MQLTFKRLHPDAELPAYAHEGDSGMDLRAAEDAVLLPGVPTLVKTGLAVELPEKSPFPQTYILFEAQIRPRSGLALKHGVTVVNAPGTVDSGFRGEIGVILRWDGHNGNCVLLDQGILANPRDIDFGGAMSTEPEDWMDCALQRELSDDHWIGYKVRKGDRIAQMVIAPVVRCNPEWGEVGETERGGGGFGSTGK